MNENDEPEPGAYHEVSWGDIQPPERVRCMECGEMAELEANERGFDLTLWVYACAECRHWTEWEIVPDEDDGIYSSSVWLVDMDDEDRESFPRNGSEYYWRPNEDGFTAPDFEAVEVAE